MWWIWWAKSWTTGIRILHSLVFLCLYFFVCFSLVFLKIVIPAFQLNDAVLGMGGRGNKVPILWRPRLYNLWHMWRKISSINNNVYFSYVYNSACNITIVQPMKHIHDGNINSGKWQEHSCPRISNGSIKKRARE